MKAVSSFFAILTIFIFASVNLAASKVLLTNESCSESVFDFIPDLYFATDKPFELFEILGKDVGSFNSRGEWVSDPVFEVEFIKFFEENQIDPELQKQRADKWKSENDGFLSHHRSKQSSLSYCTVYVQIDGEITDETLHSFKSLLASYANPPFPHVSLNSVGGEIFPAMEIGRIIRSQYGITQVGKQSGYKGNKGVGCFSACVLIYAAGIAKNIDLNENGNGYWYPVGVHQHFLSRNQLESMSVEEGIELLKASKNAISDYLTDMGVSQEFLSLSNSINSDDLHYLSDKELRLYLPFAVAEYSAVLPVKVTQSRTGIANIFFQGMDMAIKNLGQDVELIEYFSELENIMKNNEELIKWGSYQSWYIENGIYYQGLN